MAALSSVFWPGIACFRVTNIILNLGPWSNSSFLCISKKTSDFLDQLCSLLYDVLRPHIIHSNHLETLAELCFILRVEMIDEHVSNNRNLN